VSGIVILGNNNVVRVEYVDLFKKLEQLENELKLNNQLTTEQKLDLQADIQVIKDQLVKMQPNKNIIQRAIQSLSFLSSIPGLMDLFDSIKKMIEKLF
jgi:cell division protein FtsX